MMKQEFTNDKEDSDGNGSQNGANGDGGSLTGKNGHMFHVTNANAVIHRKGKADG